MHVGVRVGVGMHVGMHVGVGVGVHVGVGVFLVLFGGALSVFCGCFVVFVHPFVCSSGRRP